MGLEGLGEGSGSARTPPRTPKGVQTGLQDCSPVVHRTRNWDWGLYAETLTRRPPAARRILRMVF